MKISLVALVASLFPLALSGCGADDPSEDTPLHFTEASLESLPLVAEGADAGVDGYTVYADGPETAASYDMLGDFFRYECHEWPNFDYCPPGIDVEENDGMNSTKFTNDALIGFIHHAEATVGGLKSRCGLTKGAIDAGSFQSAAGGGAEPDRFVLDTYDLFTCKGALDADGSGVNTRYVAYSVAPGYQATLASAFRHHAPETPESEQTDVYQVYVGLDGTSPRVLAFNFAAATTFYNRVILLVKFATHRFAAKLLSAGMDNPEVYLVAAGVGGIDRDSGEEFPGHYWASFVDNDQATPLTACVDNVGQIVEADDAPCAAEEIPVAWASADDIATYLELSADDRTRLAAFLDKLATADPLPSTDVAHSDEEVDLYFPSSIE
ncbi:MAG: hypothetical protein M0R80_22035 [Proteobacteria bacterium]|jgi:hypothetical protein|nr:hypothetical protein [Pseudomonadota bacterium]